MTKIKASIIQTLKEFEQRDFKRGGVSIAPEMYNAIADKLYSRLLDENKDGFTGYEYDKKLLIDYGVKIQEYLLKPPFNLEHSQHGIVWGDENAVLADTTPPAFGDDDIQSIVLKLKNNGTAGAWKFNTTVIS